MTSFAGQHDTASQGVGAHLVERFSKGAERRWIQSVPDLGAVDGHQGHAMVDSRLHKFLHDAPILLGCFATERLSTRPEGPSGPTSATTGPHRSELAARDRSTAGGKRDLLAGASGWGWTSSLGSSQG